MANLNFHGTIRRFGFSFKKYLHNPDISREVRKLEETVTSRTFAFYPGEGRNAV